jgi:hypothetical protein
MKYVLKGRVVTMDAASTVLQAGAVYVDGKTIAAVRDSSAPPPADFAGATILNSSGIIFPGLIELHNHLSYDALTMWSVPRKFVDRGQWQDNADYKHRVSDPMNTIAKSNDPHLLASLVRYVETKCLLAGVTSSQGISLKSDQLDAYYRSAMRVVEDPTEHQFPKANTHIPDVAASEWTQFKKTLDRASCLLLHLSEGLDDKARAAFLALQNRYPLRWPASGGFHRAGGPRRLNGVVAVEQPDALWGHHEDRRSEIGRCPRQPRFRLVTHGKQEPVERAEGRQDRQ